MKIVFADEISAARPPSGCGHPVIPAKAISLQAIQHVTAESGRLHLLLAKTALSMGDKGLFREAKTFLEFLRQDQALRELHEVGSDSQIPN
jgi:hypothetical protein